MERFVCFPVTRGKYLNKVRRKNAIVVEKARCVIGSLPKLDPWISSLLLSNQFAPFELSEGGR